MWVILCMNLYGATYEHGGDWLLILASIRIKCFMNVSHVTYEYVLCHIWTWEWLLILASVRIKSHMNVSHFIYESILCHICGTREFVSECWLLILASIRIHSHMNVSHFMYESILCHIETWRRLTTHVGEYTNQISYGVATISRLHKMIGLFCRISSLL